MHFSFHCFQHITFSLKMLFSSTILKQYFYYYYYLLFLVCVSKWKYWMLHLKVLFPIIFKKKKKLKTVIAKMENSQDFSLFLGLIWFLPTLPLLRSFAPCQKAKQTGQNPALLTRGRKAHLFELRHWSIQSICLSRHALNFFFFII